MIGVLFGMALSIYFWHLNHKIDRVLYEQYLARERAYNMSLMNFQD